MHALLPHTSRSTSGSGQQGIPVDEKKALRMVYFEQEDILHLVLSDESEEGSVEINPNITVELNDKGELIGIEILNTSAFLRDSILESVQAKVLQLSGA